MMIDLLFILQFSQHPDDFIPVHGHLQFQARTGWAMMNIQDNCHDEQ